MPWKMLELLREFAEWVNGVAFKRSTRIPRLERPSFGARAPPQDVGPQTAVRCRSAGAVPRFFGPGAVGVWAGEWVAGCVCVCPKTLSGSTGDGTDVP